MFGGVPGLAGRFEVIERGRITQVIAGAVAAKDVYHRETVFIDGAEGVEEVLEQRAVEARSVAYAGVMVP